MPPPKKPKPKPKAKPAKPKAKPVKTAVRVSLQTDGLQEGVGSSLPRGTVTLGKTGLKINVARLSRSLLRDQRASLASSMGCISNPGGPGC